MRRPAPAIRSTRGEDVTRSPVLRAVPFVSQLAPAANRARPIQASRTRNCPHSRAQDVAGSTQRPQVRSRRTRSRFLFILFHLFRLLMQLRRPHTPAARTRSTTKVCILNISFLFQPALWPANLSAHTAMVNRRLLHVSLTVDRVAI